MCFLCAVLDLIIPDFGMSCKSWTKFEIGRSLSLVKVYIIIYISSVGWNYYCASCHYFKSLEYATLLIYCFVEHVLWNIAVLNFFPLVFFFLFFMLLILFLFNTPYHKLSHSVFIYYYLPFSLITSLPISSLILFFSHTFLCFANINEPINPLDPGIMVHM